MFIITVITISILVSLIIIIVLNIFSSSKEYIKNIAQKNNSSPKKLKAKCFASLDKINYLYKLGDLTDDQVYIEVSKSLRIYASERTNVNFKTSTKRDLKEIDGIHIFSKTIETLYESEFTDRKSASELLTPEAAISLVRAAVRSW